MADAETAQISPSSRYRGRSPQELSCAQTQRTPPISGVKILGGEISTLVAENVVLTAAHCTDFLQEDGEEGFGPDDLRGSFDPDPDDGSTYYDVDHIVVHPDWFTAPLCRGNSKRLCLASPAEDIALVWLQNVVAGVDPAPVAGASYLDALDLKSEVFTVVGYGVDDFITGSTVSRKPIILVDGIRSYRDVSVISEHDASRTGSWRSLRARASAIRAGRSSTMEPSSGSTPGPSACGAKVPTSRTEWTPR